MNMYKIIDKFLGIKSIEQEMKEVDRVIDIVLENSKVLCKKHNRKYFAQCSCSDCFTEKVVETFKNHVQ